jgi:hypothetical protein
VPIYLVGFTFHEPEGWILFQRGIVEDCESSTGLFVEAEVPDAALKWAAHVASELLKHVNRDPSLDWEALGDWCWIEEDPERSPWSHCLAFFQCVKVGEMPDLSEMGAEAYTRWAKRNGITCRGSS